MKFLKFFYARHDSSLASKPATSLGTSTGFFNTDRKYVVAPKKRWSIKNTHATDDGVFNLTLTLLPK